MSPGDMTASGGSGVDPSQGYLFMDPRQLRAMALSRGLMDAGAAMLAQGPSPYPISFGQTLGRGLLGSSQGMDAAYGDAMRQGYLGLQTAAEERKRGQQAAAQPQDPPAARMQSVSAPLPWWTLWGALG